MVHKLREFSGSLDPYIRSDSNDKLEQLHAMLRKIPSLKDDDIAAGIQLTDSGLRKVEQRLGVDRKEVELLIAKLRSRLHADDQIDESVHERYSYEAGFLNDVTIFDSETGKKTTLSGSRGSSFLTAIKGGIDPQTLMAKAFQMPSMNESAAPVGEFLYFCPKTGRYLLAQYDRTDTRHGQWGMWSKKPVDRYHQTGYSNRPSFAEQFGRDVIGHVGVEFDPHIGANVQNFKWCKAGQWPSPLTSSFKDLLVNHADVFAGQNLDEEDDLSPTASDSFDEELGSNVGSFNFPWQIGGRHGFACARYHGRGPDMSIVIASVVDSTGRALSAHDMSEQLETVAREHIEKGLV